MSRRGTISVVITTYNRAALLPTAIESVLAQTRPPDELIVVDEGNPEQTRAVVERYPQACYLWKDKEGLAVARNTGMRAATGDYINFLDDDDWFAPRKLEAQSALLDAQPDLDLVYCRLERATAPGVTSGQYLRGHRPPPDPVAALLRENYILAHAPLIRRRRLLEVGGFDPDPGMAEDWDCWLRLALSGARFHFCDEILATVRVTPGSMSSDRSRQALKIEAVLAKNSPHVHAYRSRDGREWWLAGPQYIQGRLALAAGDIPTAADAFRRALTYNPRHTHARGYLWLTRLPAPVRDTLLRARVWKRRAVVRCAGTFGVESRWQ
jgi:glycosyltransferase involved in cell wall biosynthesis